MTPIIALATIFSTHALATAAAPSENPAANAETTATPSPQGKAEDAANDNAENSQDATIAAPIPEDSLTATPPVTPPPPGESDPEAKKILDQTEQAYAQCESYQDTGLVTTEYLLPQGKYLERRPFTTAFARPDRFRFAFEVKTGDYTNYKFVAWRDQDQIKSWWSIVPGVKTYATLSVALISAGGISGGSAHYIPALLMPRQVGGSEFTNIDELKRAGEETLVDHTVCHLLKGKMVETPVTLWIDKKTHLIRIILLEIGDAKLSQRRIITYQPALNGEIPPDSLDFGVPKDQILATPGSGDGD